MSHEETRRVAEERLLETVREACAKLADNAVGYYAAAQSQATQNSDDEWALYLGAKASVAEAIAVSIRTLDLSSIVGAQP